MTVAEEPKPEEIDVPEAVEFPVEETPKPKDIKWEKCDQKCPAEAKHVFISSESEFDLVFCDHHAREQAEELGDQGFFELISVEPEEGQKEVVETIDSDDDDTVE